MDSLVAEKRNAPFGWFSFICCLAPCLMGMLMTPACSALRWVVDRMAREARQLHCDLNYEDGSGANSVKSPLLGVSISERRKHCRTFE
jgi:hypothetical protein